MKCMIVEDDAASRELLRVHLMNYGNCYEVPNGLIAAEAFRAALEENDPYDLICLDLMMPHMNGHETLCAIRETEQEYGVPPERHVKVMVVSALDDMGNIFRANQHGCDVYVTKPIREKNITDAMQKMGFVQYNEV